MGQTLGWTEPDPVGERGFETSYRSTGSTSFVARLLFDCHADPRRLEVALPEPGFSDSVLTCLRPFGRALRLGQLAIVDRPGYFRINLVPGRLQALVRKEAPRSVLAELIAQLEAVHDGPQPQATDCAVGALSYATGRLQIDDALCTGCLDCVRPLVRAEYLPPAELAGEEAQPGQAPRCGGA